MKRVSLRLLCSAGILCFFSVVQTDAGEVLEDTLEKTVPLDAKGTFTLTNIDGSVQVYGSRKPEVKIIAIKKAFSPERLNAIRIEVNAGNGQLAINTSLAPPGRSILSDRSGTVDYIINIPFDARIGSIEVPNGELIIDGMRGPAVAAKLGNGRLTAHNCFCDQTLQVKTGGLDVFFDWAEDKTITIDGTIQRGNARALIPSDASFELHAAAEHGHIASDFSDIEHRRPGGVSKVEEVIGTPPRSRLSLRAKEGNVRLSEVVW